MDVLGSVKYWDILIYNYLKRILSYHKKVGQLKSQRSLRGAYVKDPQVGIHKWVMSFDLNGCIHILLCSIIYQLETLVSQDKVKDMSVDKLLSKKTDTSFMKSATLTPNGALFKTQQKVFFQRLWKRCIMTE